MGTENFEEKDNTMFKVYIQKVYSGYLVRVHDNPLGTPEAHRLTNNKRESWKWAFKYLNKFNLPKEAIIDQTL